MTIDLNCDLGEGMGDDAAMIEIVSSVNIACGFHAGNADLMLATVQAAKERGVSVGAHPSYHDVENFGRKPMPGLSASAIEALVAYQIGALQAVASLAGHSVTHVKPHGALSNAACKDDLIAAAIARAIKSIDQNLCFVVLPNTALARAAEAAGLHAIHEIYADRAYEDDAQLVSRSKSGAVIHDPKIIAERVLRMIEDRCIIAASGKIIPATIDTVCVHGDTPGAVDIARQLRVALEKREIAIKPFSSWR